MELRGFIICVTYFIGFLSHASATDNNFLIHLTSDNTNLVVRHIYLQLYIYYCKIELQKILKLIEIY